MSLSREWLSLLEEEMISSENEKRQNPPSEAERLPLFMGLGLISGNLALPKSLLRESRILSAAYSFFM